MVGKVGEGEQLQAVEQRGREEIGDFPITIADIRNWDVETLWAYRRHHYFASHCSIVCLFIACPRLVHHAI